MKTQTTFNTKAYNERNWEIGIWIFGIIFLAFLFSNNTLRADIPQFEDESYINDIPFDTEMIVHNLQLPDLNFEDEEYADDIPFNTERVVANYKFKSAVSHVFEMEEEDYVDDLPFDTRAIANRVIYDEAINTAFLMTDEDYIDDIPFDTYTIAQTADKTSGAYQYALMK